MKKIKPTCRECKHFMIDPMSGQTACAIGKCGVDSREIICKKFKAK